MEHLKLEPAHLKGGPWCGKPPSINAMLYRNTGRVYGYRLRCVTCNYERWLTPQFWEDGKENEVMDAAKAKLLEWWNARQ